MITLISSDNETFEVEEVVMMVSQTIKHLIEDNRADKPIYLLDVTSEVLSKVIEFCRHQHDSAFDTDFKNFDTEFLKVDADMIIDLISAAADLGIKRLLDLAVEGGIRLMRGKTPDEIRKTFHVYDEDYTDPEEEEILVEIVWALRVEEELAKLALPLGY